MSRVKELWKEQAEFYNEMHLGDITYHASQAVIVDLLPKTGPSACWIWAPAPANWPTASCRPSPGVQSPVSTSRPR